MRVAANARELEMQGIRRHVEETERRLRAMPSAEEKYAETMERTQ
jgi:hypothetical protein